MKARVSESPLIKELLGETTPEEMERIDKEMSKQQTAVEWLACEIGGLDTGVSYHYFAKKVEEAKEMEKEQKIIDYEMGYISGGNQKSISGEQYYNETYGGKNE